MTDPQQKARLEAYIMSTIENMQKLIYTDQTAKVLNEVRNKDIVIFLGNTRCGKSTVVNNIIGNKLRATLVRKNVFNVVLEDPSDLGPTIGIESVSETTIPTSWASTKINGVIVDAPGFDDNRGEAQDVANAFYIKELITNANTVKFVLICDINDILHHNVGQYVTFIDKIHTMLPNSCILPGVCVVFTKDRHEHSKVDIADMLKEKIINQYNMKVKNRELVEHIYRNKNKIVVTNMPLREGTIDEGDVFQDIVGTIQNHTENLSRDVLSKVLPGISDKSKCFLLEAHARFTELEDFDHVMLKAEREFDSKVKSIETENDQEFKVKISQLEKDVNSIKMITNHYDALSKLYEMLPQVEELNANSQFHMKLKFIAFVDSVLEIEESGIFKVKIQSTLAHMIDILSQKRIKLQEKTMEINHDEAEKRYQQLRDENRNTQQEMQKKIDHLTTTNENIKKNSQKKLGMFSMLGEFIDKAIDMVTMFKK